MHAACFFMEYELVKTLTALCVCAMGECPSPQFQHIRALVDYHLSQMNKYITTCIVPLHLYSWLKFWQPSFISCAADWINTTLPSMKEKTLGQTKSVPKLQVSFHDKYILIKLTNNNSQGPHMGGVLLLKKPHIATPTVDFVSYLSL